MKRGSHVRSPQRMWLSVEWMERKNAPRSALRSASGRSCCSVVDLSIHPAVVGGQSSGSTRRRSCCPLRLRSEASIQVRPRLRSIETADAQFFKFTRVEVPDIHAQPTVGLHLQWLPMGDTSAAAAPDGSKRLVAPGVFVRMFRLTNNPHGTDRVVRPQRAQAAADRAIAERDRFGTTGQLQSERPRNGRCL